MKPVVFLPEAEQEMLEAARYYESQASGLGIDYLSEIERAVVAISESPMTWPILEGKLRRRLVRILFRHLEKDAGSHLHTSIDKQWEIDKMENHGKTIANRI